MSRKPKKLNRPQSKGLSVCDRYRAVSLEANGYMWMRIVVAVVMIVCGFISGYYSAQAVSKLPPLAIGAGVFTVSFAGMAIPYIQACIRCKGIHAAIDIDWGLCLQNGSDEQQIDNKMKSYRQKLARASSLLPKQEK